MEGLAVTIVGEAERADEAELIVALLAAHGAAATLVRGARTPLGHTAEALVLLSADARAPTTGFSIDINAADVRRLVAAELVRNAARLARRQRDEVSD